MSGDDVIAITKALAALQQSVDDFHKTTFPTYCKGIEMRMSDLKHAVDTTNHRLGVMEKWRVQLEAVGWAVRNQWIAVVAAVGLTATVIEIIDRMG